MNKRDELKKIYTDFINKYDAYYIESDNITPAAMLYNMYEIKKEFLKDDFELLPELNEAIAKFENIIGKFSVTYITFFVNFEILPQLNNYTWADIMPFKEIVKELRKFRHDQIKAGTASKNDVWTAKVNDGFLYINDIPVVRIVPKLPKMPYDEYSHYIEGRILARGEID